MLYLEHLLILNGIIIINLFQVAKINLIGFLKLKKRSFIIIRIVFYLN